MNLPSNWKVNEEVAKEYVSDFAEMLDHNTAPLGSAFEAKTGPLNTKETSYGIQDPTQPLMTQVDVGQPELEEGEKVIDSSALKGINYYLVQDKDGNFYTTVPSIGREKETYKSSKRATRQAALEDAFKVLNVQPPSDTIGQLRSRFPEWTT
jgi:hypothetical protein